MGDTIPTLGFSSVSGNRTGVEYAAKAIPVEPEDSLLNISGDSNNEAAPEVKLLMKAAPDTRSSLMSFCN